MLVQHPPNASRTRVEPTPSHILLESWTLTFQATTVSSSQSSSPTTSSTSSSGEVSLATVYKHIMSVIRSMYTMLRVLPAWRICKRLRRRPGAARQNGQLGIDLRVYTQGDEGMQYLDFGKRCPISPLMLILKQFLAPLSTQSIRCTPCSGNYAIANSHTHLRPNNAPNGRLLSRCYLPYEPSL